ncbi:hypothetical protein [Bacillus sp. NPDC094106]|uniref:hypothetical protein n=1 Tax=Bacillus sp. NPDC094106 TaxID=3363949 RepID=UPI00380738BE
MLSIVIIDLVIAGDVIAWTVAKMIIHEPFLKPYFLSNPILSILYWGTVILIAGGIVLAGKITNLKE